MKKNLLLSLLCCALLSAGLSGFANAEGKKDQKKPADVCFVNPSFQGVCTVSPSADETADGILNYLNSNGTVGKTYCGTSKIRGGWKLADCKTGKEIPPQKSSR